MNAWIVALPTDKVATWLAKNGEAACERYYTDDPVFALWLHYVDRATRRRVLLGFMDLEDWDYWSAYEAGQSPAEAAVEMLADNGYADAYEKVE